MLKRVLAALGLALALFVLGAAALLYVALERTALVSRAETISPAAVEQARTLLRANDPRRLHAGEVRQVSIPASLVDEGLNHFASRLGSGRATFAIDGGQAIISASFRLPYLSARPYLNVRAIVVEAQAPPRLKTLHLGSVPLPAMVVGTVGRVLLSFSGYTDEWALVHGAVRTAKLSPAGNAVKLVFVWHPELLERARTRALALGSGEQLGFETAQRALAALLTHRARDAALDLSSILQVMLALPADDPQAQRRASLLILAAYMAEKNFAAIVPEAAHWPRPAWRLLTLRGRHDSAQHFVVSAALAAWAGEPVASAIGLYKELDDGRRGSGFSFADLAANRAGTRFGKLVLDEPERIDAMLAGALVDTDLLPTLRGLPEYLSEREFVRRYGGIDSPAYRSLVEEIERRVDAQPLYR